MRTRLLVLGALAFMLGWCTAGHAATGVASVYCDKHVAWHSARMHCKDLTVAHRTLKFGTRVKITYKLHSIVAVVTDRGPYVKGRIVDLSTGAARALHLPGLGRVTVAVIKGVPHESPMDVPPRRAGFIVVFGDQSPVKETVTAPLRKINLPPVGSSQVSSPIPQESSMDWASLIWKGFALLGMAGFAWTVGKYGWSVVATKVSSAFSVAKADFVALEARVKQLENQPPAAPPPATASKATPV